MGLRLMFCVESCEKCSETCLLETAKIQATAMNSYKSIKHKHTPKELMMTHWDSDEIPHSAFTTVKSISGTHTHRF